MDKYEAPSHPEDMANAPRAKEIATLLEQRGELARFARESADHGEIFHDRCFSHRDGPDGPSRNCQKLRRFRSLSRQQ